MPIYLSIFVLIYLNIINITKIDNFIICDTKQTLFLRYIIGLIAVCCLYISNNFNFYIFIVIEDDLHLGNCFGTHFVSQCPVKLW